MRSSKKYSKSLESRTSTYLRVRAPSDLEETLEGLVRKVIVEQPKTQDLYKFAAEYFESLLRIRSQAGVQKKNSKKICPFHNDPEAGEKILLACNIPKLSKENDADVQVPAVERSVKGKINGNPKRTVKKQKSIYLGETSFPEPVLENENIGQIAEISEREELDVVEGKTEVQKDSNGETERASIEYKSESDVVNVESLNQACEEEEITEVHGQEMEEKEMSPSHVSEEVTIELGGAEVVEASSVKELESPSITAEPDGTEVIDEVSCLKKLESHDINDENEQVISNETRIEKYENQVEEHLQEEGTNNNNENGELSGNNETSNIVISPTKSEETFDICAVDSEQNFSEMLNPIEHDTQVDCTLTEVREEEKDIILEESNELDSLQNMTECKEVNLSMESEEQKPDEKIEEYNEENQECLQVLHEGNIDLISFKETGEEELSKKVEADENKESSYEGDEINVTIEILTEVSPAEPDVTESEVELKMNEERKEILTEEETAETNVETDINFVETSVTEYERTLQEVDEGNITSKVVNESTTTLSNEVSKDSSSEEVPFISVQITAHLNDEDSIDDNSKKEETNDSTDNAAEIHINIADISSHSTSHDVSLDIPDTDTEIKTVIEDIKDNETTTKNMSIMEAVMIIQTAYKGYLNRKIAQKLADIGSKSVETEVDNNQLNLESQNCTEESNTSENLIIAKDLDEVKNEESTVDDSESTTNNLTDENDRNHSSIESSLSSSTYRDCRRKLSHKTLERTGTERSLLESQGSIESIKRSPLHIDMSIDQNPESMEKDTELESKPTNTLRRKRSTSRTDLDDEIVWKEIEKDLDVLSETCNNPEETTITECPNEIKDSEVWEAIEKEIKGDEKDNEVWEQLEKEIVTNEEPKRIKSCSTQETDDEVWKTIEKELQEAATKIQSNFRGYRARKMLTREDAVQITTTASDTSNTSEDASHLSQQSTGEFHDVIVNGIYPY